MAIMQIGGAGATKKSLQIKFSLGEKGHDEDVEISSYLGKGAKKKSWKKNLTSVSFAFTHTYTAVKTNSFRFFPQAYMKKFEKCAKTGDMGTLGGGWGC